MKHGNDSQKEGRESKQQIRTRTVIVWIIRPLVPLTLKSDLTDDEPTRSNTNTLPFVTRPGSCWKILDKQLHTKISLEQERKCLCPNIQSFCFCVKPATEQNAWSCTSPNVKALEEGGADGWTILALFRIKFFYFVLWETWLACLTAPSSLMWDRCPALSRRSAGLNNVRVAIWKGFGTTRTCVC